jgi:DNA-binding winged helix-turn-helix (wHTH) protein/tetratricopeptide (TPR) repeat protein
VHSATLSSCTNTGTWLYGGIGELKLNADAASVRVVLAHEAPFAMRGLHVHPSNRQLEWQGRSETLEPRVMQVFVALAGANGRILTRDDLVELCWAGRIVGEDAINRTLSRLRGVLSALGARGFVIETITKVGYRLVFPGDEVRPHPMTVITAPENDRYLSRRLLAEYRLMADPAAPRVMPPIGRRAILAAGASLGVAVGGAALWRARRETRMAEVQRLVDRGDVLLRDAVPIQAGEALPPLQSALRIDPHDARALGLIALTEETRANNGGSANAGDALRLAEDSARAALQRDASEPHARLAMIDLMAGHLDWSQMEDRLQVVRASAPTNAHVLGSLTSFLQAAGRTSRSWIYNEQAAAAAPSSPTPQWRRALRLWTAGRNEEALSLSERLLPLWPRHALVWNARFMILAFTNRTGAAAAMLRDAGAGPIGAHPVRLEQWLPTLDAFGEPSPAHIAKARDANLAAAQLDPGQATYAAMALSHLGEIDAAFAVIDALLLSKGPLVARRPIVPRSFNANSASWCRTQWLFMPPLAAARSDARFQTVCEEIGLARYWRQRGVGPDIRIPDQQTK